MESKQDKIKSICNDENCHKNCKGCSAEQPRKECEYLNKSCTGCNGYAEMCSKFKS